MPNQEKNITNIMKLTSLLLSVIMLAQHSLAFFVVHRPTIHTPRLFLSAAEPSEEQKTIGNLVADDEWNGLSLELAEIIRLAVVEDLKKNTREFLGKEEYRVGDLSKEIDTRVKQGGTFWGERDCVRKSDWAEKEMDSKKSHQWIPRICVPFRFVPFHSGPNEKQGRLRIG